jgi:hypothetical protein
MAQPNHATVMIRRDFAIDLLAEALYETASARDGDMRVKWDDVPANFQTVFRDSAARRIALAEIKEANDRNHRSVTLRRHVSHHLHLHVV